MGLPNEAITVTLDKERHLLYDFNALALAEEMLGVNLLTGAVIALNKLGAAQLRALLYCGLKHEDPDLTLEQVGGMLVGYKVVPVIMPLVGAALAGAMPEPEPQDGAKETGPFGGSTAGPSESTTSPSPKKPSGG